MTKQSVKIIRSSHGWIVEAHCPNSTSGALGESFWKIHFESEGEAIRHIYEASRGGEMDIELANGTFIHDRDIYRYW